MLLITVYAVDLCEPQVIYAIDYENTDYAAWVEYFYQV